MKNVEINLKKFKIKKVFVSCLVLLMGLSATDASLLNNIINRHGNQHFVSCRCIHQGQ